MQIPYILLALIVPALILIILAIFLRKKEKPMGTLYFLAGISFAFIIAGIIFGENRILGYSLMGTGVLIAVVDIILKSKKK